MTPVLFWGLKIALFLLAVAMLCATARLMTGPTAQDRVMALDCLYINGMLMMLTLGIVSDCASHIVTRGVKNVTTLPLGIITPHVS